VNCLKKNCKIYIKIYIKTATTLISGFHRAFFKPVTFIGRLIHLFV